MTFLREGLTEESVAELQRMGLISIEHLLNTSEDGSDAKGDEVYVLQDELIIEDWFGTNIASLHLTVQA